MNNLSCLSHVKRSGETKERPPAPTIYTDVVWCGDRSGSMNSMGNTPSEGGKNFMIEHKTNAENMNCVLGYNVEFTTFDDIAETHFNGDGKTITTNDINAAGRAMSPRGTTKFYDTAIACIARQQKRIQEIKENLTNEQKQLYYENSHLISAVFATFTDGYDNKSIANPAALRRAIKKHEEDFGVVCMFLAANISADTCGEQFGFQRNFCMQMGSDPISAGYALRSCSAAMTRAVTQSVGNSQFTPMERERSMPTPPAFMTPPAINRASHAYTNMLQYARNISPITIPTVPAVPYNTPITQPLTPSPISIPALPI